MFVTIINKLTKMSRPTQHFYVLSHSATYLCSHELSYGTSLHNNLKNINTSERAIIH